MTIGGLIKGNIKQKKQMLRCKVLFPPDTNADHLIFIIEGRVRGKNGFQVKTKSHCNEFAFDWSAANKETDDLTAERVHNVLCSPSLFLNIPSSLFWTFSQNRITKYKSDHTFVHEFIEFNSLLHTADPNLSLYSFGEIIIIKTKLARTAASCVLLTNKLKIFCVVPATKLKTLLDNFLFVTLPNENLLL